MGRALLVACLLVPALASAETVVLDRFEGDVGAWGRAVAERARVKEGRQALRWSPIQPNDALTAPSVPADWGRFRSLGVWVHAEKPTGAQVLLALEAPDSANAYQLVFTVDWRGWTRIEVPLSAFRPIGRPAGLGRVTAFRLVYLAANLPGTSLVFDDLALSTDDMHMPFGPQRAIVDAEWRQPFQDPAAWRATALDGTQGGVNPYWSWLELGYRNRAGARDRIRFEHDLVTDLTGWDELEVRLCGDRDSYLTVTATVDGQPVVLCREQRGSGAFTNLRAPIAGRRLEHVAIDLSEPAGAAGGTDGKQIVCFLQYVGLYRREPSTGRPAAAMPLPVARETPEPLETAGLPFALYFGRDDLPRLRARAQGNPIFARIKAQADAALTSLPELRPRPFLTGGWLSSIERHEGFSTAALLPTAFTYLITGERKYADAARRMLLALCLVEHWTDGELARYPLGWGGFGNPFFEADACRDAAPAYDWIYPTLSDGDRSWIETSLRDKGLYWLDDCLQHHFPGDMNQGAVFGSGHALAALVLPRTDPDREALVKRATERMREVMGRYFGGDGWAPEGFGYWTFTMSTAVTALEPLARANHVTLAEWLPDGVKRGVLYPFYLRSNAQPRYASLNLNDGHYGGTPPSPVLLIYARALGDGRATALWHELYEANPPGDVLSFLWSDGLAAPVATPLDAVHRFGVRGATFLRTGSAYGDTLVMLQTSAARQGHDHADRNSLIFEAYGERLLIDPGQISYADPTHQELKKTWLHNTCTVEDRNQDFAPNRLGASTDARSLVRGMATTPAVSYVESDMATATSYLKRSVRRVALLPPATLVVVDELEADAPVAAQLNWMFAQPPRLDGNGFRVSGPRASLVGRVLQPAGLEPRASTWPTDTGPGYHLAMRAKPAAAPVLMTVLAATPAGAEPPTIEPLSLPGAVAARITDGDRVDVVAWRTGETVTGDGWATDARFSAVRSRAGQPVAALMAGGTHLQLGALAVEVKPPFAREKSLATTVAVERQASGAIVISHPNTELITVRLPAGAGRTVDRRISWSPEFRREQPLEQGVYTWAMASARFDWVQTVLDAPAGMSLTDSAPPRLTAVTIDDRPAPVEATVDLGERLPQNVRLKVSDAESTIDEAGIRLLCDGREVAGAAEVAERTDQGRTVYLHVQLPATLQLPASDTPVTRRFTLRVPDLALYPHTAQVELVHHGPLAVPRDAVYLSDLKPLKAFAHSGLKANVGYLGDPLRAGGILFPKGLLLHPETTADKAVAEAVYDLKAVPVRGTFAALCGVEDSTGAAGSVTFAVELLRGGRWERVYESPVVTPATGLVPVRVSLNGAEQLRLYVGDGGDGIGSDHAVWGLARVEP